MTSEEAGLAGAALPYFLDLAGTFVFALSGAIAGVKRKLDLFGVLVLSFVAANTGGITRDILIGAVPPGAIDDWRYLAVSPTAGGITFFFPSAVVRRSSAVLVFDAGGLQFVRVIRRRRQRLSTGLGAQGQPDGARTGPGE